MTIDPTDLPIVFRLVPDPKRPRLEVERDGEAKSSDARIAGPLAALIGLVHGAYDGDALFFSRDLVIEGDTAAVLALRNAIDNEEIDLVARSGRLVRSSCTAPSPGPSGTAATIAQRLTRRRRSPAINSPIIAHEFPRRARTRLPAGHARRVARRRSKPAPTRSIAVSPTKPTRAIFPD